MATSDIAEYYSVGRLRWNTLVFTCGKVVNAVLSLALFALIASQLSKSDFAIYAWLLAFVELSANISRFGVNWVVDRYVPQLRSLHDSAALRRFVLTMIGLRFVFALATVLFFYWGGRALLGLADHEDWFPAFDAYFVILIPFALLTFLRDNVFQALLQQMHSQAITTLRHLTFFLVLFGAMFWADSFTLEHVIYGDIAATVVAMIVGFIQMRYLLNHLPDSADQAPAPMPSRNALINFAANSYADDMLRMSGSGHSVMMAAPHLFTSAVIASFGFCLTLFSQLNRFLPAHLFSGLYRPRLVSTYAKNGNFENLNRQLIIILKISNYIIAGGISVFVVYGDAVLGWVSQGKYADAYGIMLLFLALMLVDNHRQVLMAMCNVIEQVKILSRSSVLMLLALPTAILLALAGLGAYGLALALVVVELLSIWVVLHLLHKAGYHLKFGLAGQVRIVLTAVLSILAGLAFHGLHPDVWFWDLAGMVFMGLCFVVIARALQPMSEKERASIERVVGRRIYVL